MAFRDGRHDAMAMAGAIIIARFMDVVTQFLTNKK